VKKRLLIVGAGGHGKVVADIAMKMSLWESIAFLDDNDSLGEVLGLKVIDKATEATKYVRDSDLFVAIGNDTIRERTQRELESAGAELPVLIHPHAVIAQDVELGVGSVVMAGVVINSCTRIGRGCIINTGATIGHDNIIEDFVHVSPGVNTGGSVRIGTGTWIGLGSKIVNNVNITGGCTVGAGAVVVKDITIAGTYVGVPARRL
jgi:sugar O-acyltransferase (sialic acid O-acetyltransferase NeuD family)